MPNNFNIPPPNVQTRFVDEDGFITHTWARWIQQLVQQLEAGSINVTTTGTSDDGSSGENLYVTDDGTVKVIKAKLPDGTDIYIPYHLAP